MEKPERSILKICIILVKKDELQSIFLVLMVLEGVIILGASP